MNAINDHARAARWNIWTLLAACLFASGFAHADPLQWDACAWGQSASGNSCAGMATSLTWQQALQAAEQANATAHQGQSDWRVPNRTELESLADLAMPGNGAFWSSTSYHPAPVQAWTVDFASGASSPADKTTALALRLVRGGDDYRLPGPVMHAVTVTPSDHGSVFCAPNPVVHGEDVVCTATPDTGYAIGHWGDACAATPAGSASCTLSNVQAPQTVSVSFTQITHAIIVTPSANGSVVCAPNPVPDGGSTVCTATPDMGYAVGTWGDACAATPAGNSTCTLTNVQAPQAVSVSFTQITHAITVTPGANGNVVCAPNPVPDGGSTVCTATPDTGYAVGTWGDACAATPAGSASCTLSNVQAPQTVSVSFTQITHAITVTPSANGSVVCAPNPVPDGGSTVCTATPDTGYAVGTWGDACAATPAGNSTCTLTNVQAPQTVSVSFAQITHAITVTPSANGSVVCALNPVPDGGSTVCTATPNSGYSIGSWGDACAATPAGNSTCTLTNVQAPQTVSVSFTQITHAITVTPSANGSVVCAPNPVPDGGSTVCTATPDMGYAVGTWGDACAATPAGNSTCTLTNVQAPQTVSVSFTQITHAITVTPSANGSVVCAPNPVPDGGSAVCTATPDAGFTLTAWQGDCAGTPAASLSCTLANVRAASGVSAQFAAFGPAPQIQFVPALDRTVQLLLALLALSLGVMALGACRR